LLAIPSDLRPEFVSLMRWQMTTLAFAFVMRIFSHILLAHQRIDIVNYTEAGRLVVAFFVLWGFFHAGHGIFSLVWTNLLGAFAGVFIWSASCWRLHLLPPAGAWGRASWRHFHELFSYGSSLFVMVIGNQLIVASQLMIITRRLGLETAALWAVGTRVFTLLSQIIWRPFDVSIPAIIEMMVRGEHKLLRERYETLVILTVSLSGFAAVAFALCNQSFVAAWTGFEWPAINDVFLGLWMLVMAVIHCHNSLIVGSKQIGRMPYVYLGEGLAYVISAFLLAKVGGLPAIIACSVVCGAACTFTYGIWRVSRYFGLPIREVGLGWIIPMIRVVALFAPVAVVAAWALKPVADPIIRLAGGVLLSGTFGFYIFLRVGLPRNLQRELLERLPKSINPVLRRVFAVPAQ
jgi:O-antigen/teichoic acid export membrane protein